MTTPDDLVSRAGADEFEKPRASGETFYSSAQYDPVHGEPFMTIAMPLVDLQSGEFTGVLTANFRFKKVWDLLAEARVEGSGLVYVLDAEGRVIAHKNPTVVLQDARFALPERDGFYAGLDGTQVALASSRIQLGEQAFDVVAELAATEALALAIATIQVASAAILVALAVAGVLSLLAARQIVRPVETLSETAQAISGGDLSRQAQVAGHDEIGKLARAFNHMTLQLRELIATLEERVRARTHKLESVATVGGRLNAILDFDQLLIELVDQVKERFNYYQVQVYLLDEQRQNWVLARGHGEIGGLMRRQGAQIPLHTPRSLIAQAAREQRVVLIPDVHQKPDWLPNSLLPDTRAELTAPIVAEDQVVGVLDVQSDHVGGLEESDADMLRSLANQVGVALTNARLFQQITHANAEIGILNERLKDENLRMAAELNVTRQLQQMLLPTDEELARIEGVDIAGFMEPAEEVGGDYYDVLQHNGQVKIGMGDVTGHGLESGVVMLMIQTAVRTLLVSDERSPVRFMDVLNRTLHANMQRMNVDKSLSLALLDYGDGLAGGRGRLRLSGQHEFLIVVRQRGQVELVNTADLGFPVGLVEGIADFVGELSIELAPGDGIVLYSDGFAEAQNEAGEFYGLERLCRAVSESWAGSAEQVKQAAVRDVREFIGGQTVYDDLTLLVVKQVGGER
jgi:serine phosphatase RsbU (regulator of sigma subunit)/HAMP domain-containing protein